ncbi:TetR/AcrR family transcriptional regulator [Umezawaea tangerina]|uniref:TetR/AcrR family transcriptional regulator n=1 Tax=Umezawaea tangerina TaxID=84725 RepID=UPI000D06927E|nr:TetR/AcrR family transcriptional regulator C-terminal domain-containing protein [Umezawaea tangerina]
MDTDEPPASTTRPRPTEADTGDVVWLRGGSDRASRRAEPLTLERIIVAAVAELDEHGAERLTMRRLAQRLAVTSTALYWHVSTKEDLYDLVLDHVLADVPIPAADADPRSGVRDLLIGWRAAMLAHPWSPSLLGRPMLGPNVLARTEFLQATLTRAGLSGIDLASATSVLAEFVIGAAITETTWLRLNDPAALAKARTHIAGLSRLYPTLNATGFVDRTQWSEDDLFRFGLDRVLDAFLR